MDKTERQKLPVRKLEVCFPIPQSCYHKGKISAVKKFNFPDKIIVAKKETQRVGYAGIRYEGRKR